MQDKSIKSIVIAFILALIVSVIVYYVQSKRSGVESILAPENKIETVQVLVSRFPLVPGDRFNPAKFKWQDWPDSSVSSEYYVGGDSKKLKPLEGAVVKYKILSGEPLKKSDLVAVKDKSALSAFIAPGMKGVAVPYKRVANPNVHIFPGDFVDIILPTRQKGNKHLGDTVISGVKVIAVDGKFYMSKKDMGEDPPTTITLEVDSAQAEELAASIRQGHIVISSHSALAPPKRKAGVKRIVKDKKVAVIRGEYKL